MSPDVERVRKLAFPYSLSSWQTINHHQHAPHLATASVSAPHLVSATAAHRVAPAPAPAPQDVEAAAVARAKAPLLAGTSVALDSSSQTTAVRCVGMAAACVGPWHQCGALPAFCLGYACVYCRLAGEGCQVFKFFLQGGQATHIVCMAWCCGSAVVRTALRWLIRRKAKSDNPKNTFLFGLS